MEYIHKISEVLNYVPSKFKVAVQQYNWEDISYKTIFISGASSSIVSFYMGPFISLSLSAAQYVNSYDKGVLKYDEYYKSQFNQIHSDDVKGCCIDSLYIDYAGMVGKILGNIASFAVYGMLGSSKEDIDFFIIGGVTLSMAIADMKIIENEFDECIRSSGDYLKSLPLEQFCCGPLVGELVSCSE